MILLSNELTVKISTRNKVPLLIPETGRRTQPTERGQQQHVLVGLPDEVGLRGCGAGALWSRRRRSLYVDHRHSASACVAISAPAFPKKKNCSTFIKRKFHPFKKMFHLEKKKVSEMMNDVTKSSSFK
jgi:hypothetical protein